MPLPSTVCSPSQLTQAYGDFCTQGRHLIFNRHNCCAVEKKPERNIQMVLYYCHTLKEHSPSCAIRHVCPRCPSTYLLTIGIDASTS